MTNNDLSPIFQAQLADFEACEKIIKHHSKSFYRAFSQLPRQRALSVFAIYAFCREADDSIDLHHDPLRLARLKMELADFLDGKIPDRAFWRALVPVFATYRMDQQAFYDMIVGQEKDIAFSQPESQADLESYGYYVAGTVGLMLLPILSERPEAIKEAGIQLGIAMQLTNILRDVGEDLRNERVYFPKEVMRQYAVSKADLRQHLVSEAFIAMWESEAVRAEALYEKAQGMLPAIEPSCQEALLSALVFYRAILNAVRENHYQCFTTRHYVNKSRQLQLYLTVKKELKRSR